MGVMRNWSFDETNNKESDNGAQVDPVKIALYNKLISLKRYKKLVSNISIDIFLQSSYEVTPKRKMSGQRYLEFFWADFCAQEVVVSFDINENTPEAISQLYLDIQIKNRKFTNMTRPPQEYFVEEKLLASI